MCIRDSVKNGASEPSPTNLIPENVTIGPNQMEFFSELNFNKLVRQVIALSRAWLHSEPSWTTFINWCQMTLGSSLMSCEAPTRLDDRVAIIWKPSVWMDGSRLSTILWSQSLKYKAFRNEKLIPFSLMKDLPFHSTIGLWPNILVQDDQTMIKLRRSSK